MPSVSQDREVCKFLRTMFTSHTTLVYNFKAHKSKTSAIRKAKPLKNDSLKKKDVF